MASPPPPHALLEDAHSDGDSSSSTSDPLDLSKDEGWDDVELDEESEPVISLFSDKVFPDARAMLNDCKENFHFDLVRVQKDLGLDFLGTIRLVNYIRSEVKTGNLTPDVSSAALFDDEQYLRPVLEDDALLYNLDDLSEEYERDRKDVGKGCPGSKEAETDPISRIKELEDELDRMRSDFEEYKTIVKRSLDKELNGALSSTAAKIEASGSSKFHEAESEYFKSYSYNGIHESMLKDSVRTDAYRDFIYDNKSLFKDKIVLDVGCGTGILSMFCAKAGAKMVVAVDNSDIIDRAREIVYDNGFGDVIKCIRGKIEEVELPVPQVDIIVSEWMGYCLLFEAMFDSVIWARDRYLAPDGLMVPSHTTLQIAPLANPDLVDSHITFWNSVYGFKMSSMLLNIYDEALVRCIEKPEETIVAKASPFLQLPLHTITVQELTFIKEFEVTLRTDIDALDGWAVWFDTFFMPSRTSKVADNAVPRDMKKEGFVAFSTGPFDPETHWQQGVFLINHGKTPAMPLMKGQVIKGHVEYRKKDDKSRLLDIRIDWDIEGVERGRQEWSLQ
ncbi:type I ribosomal protein arginine N-methytransferase Rmt3 [Histoplasma capsulatum H143]|uniref:type I protein arginine methyltransferase n=1 Tax=Ajellomyces capsulatus (strain H143) TaxID=544712 RepID=C6HCE0_AJECH|nr:type I ribosomal protein arginine N-methytransferase Rmt3 [Histoplasma capsulatum H143]